MKAKHDRQTILIVDDSVEIIDVLDETLSPDYEILICLTGAEALELLQRDDTVDLILLDVLMPEMDGYEVCRRLKSGEKTKDIPVLFVTALDDVEDEVRGLRIGAIDYITNRSALQSSAREFAIILNSSGNGICWKTLLPSMGSRA